MLSDLGDKIYLAAIRYWWWWWEVDNEKDVLARTILTVTVATLLVFWGKWKLSSSGKSTPPLPPGPWGLPIVGYLPFLGSNLHERLTQMAHTYGPIFRLQLGTKLHVVVNSADLAKVVLRDQDQAFANRDPPLVVLAVTYGGKDLAWSDGNSHWRDLRLLLVNQVLSKANLEAGRSFRRDEVRKTINDVYNKKGTEINVNEIAFVTERNIITSILWGSSKSDGGEDSIGAEFREVEFKIIDLVAKPNVSDFFPMLSCFDLQRRVREMKTQSEYFDKIVDRIIEGKMKANSENDERKDFLQILLDLKEQRDTPTTFGITEIKALLIDIVVAATDTTSTMAEWVMTEILNNPVVTKRVQDELAQVIGTKNVVEESHLPKLRYLDTVVKETFRLHPPLPLLIQRCPNKSCVVGGYVVPKGSIVYVNIWAIHRDPQNWSNPSEFDPARFLNGDGTNTWDYGGNDFRFLPFGSGRRICPGIQLGEKMLKYILASLLHSFDWRLPRDKEFDLSDEFGFVTKKGKPLIAIPSQRLLDAGLYAAR